MSTSTDKQDAQGRSWDRITKDGTSSAGSMGVGGTGKFKKASGGGSLTGDEDMITGMGNIKLAGRLLYFKK